MHVFIEAPTLEVRASDDDLKRFLSSESQLFPDFISEDLELQDAIQGTIAEAADGS